MRPSIHVGGSPVSKPHATNHLTLRDETVPDFFGYALLRVFRDDSECAPLQTRAHGDAERQTEKPPPNPRWIERRNGQKLSGGRGYRE